MTEFLKITSRQDGFRRAGIAHPGVPTLRLASDFTAEQVAALLAEPMLVVDVVELDDPPAAALDPMPAPGATTVVPSPAVEPDPDPAVNAVGPELEPVPTEAELDTRAKRGKGKAAG